MFFLPLGIVSLLGSVGVFAYAQDQGGTHAVTTVSGHVLTGTILYGIAAMLAIAGVLFILSSLVKALRRIAALVAVVFVLGGGGIGTFLPQSVNSYISNHCTSIKTGAAASACGEVVKNK